jgi:anti-sigma factor RsiW
MTMPARPSKRCRALLIDVSRLLDGELSPARCRSLERHVRACACCGTLAWRLRRTVAACRAEGARPLPREARRRAAARIEVLLASQGSPIRRRRRRSRATLP